MTISPAVHGDAEVIGRIAEATGLFPAAMAAELMAPSADGTSADIWLAVRDPHGIAGFAYCVPEALTAGTWNLRAIAVDPRAQGQGIGAALLEGVERRVGEAGGHLLVIETSDAADQAVARAMYAARHYREVGRIPDFWELGVGKIIFCKPLSLASTLTN